MEQHDGIMSKQSRNRPLTTTEGRHRCSSCPQNSTLFSAQLDNSEEETRAELRVFSVLMRPTLSLQVGNLELERLSTTASSKPDLVFLFSAFWVSSFQRRSVLFRYFKRPVGALLSELK